MALAALLLYQGTNAGIYYLLGVGIWGWAYVEGEVSFFSFFFSVQFWSNRQLTVSSYRLFVLCPGRYHGDLIGRDDWKRCKYIMTWSILGRKGILWLGYPIADFLDG